MASRNLSLRELSRWSPVGVVSSKQKLGPGRWDSHSYVVAEIREAKPLAFACANYECFDAIFADMAERGVVMSAVNMFYVRDHDANPLRHNDYYAFFVTLADALIFHTYAEGMSDEVLGDGRRSVFFKFLNESFPSQTLQRP